MTSEGPPAASAINDTLASLVDAATELAPAAEFSGMVHHRLRIGGDVVAHRQTYSNGQLVGWLLDDDPPTGPVLELAGSWRLYAPPTKVWLPELTADPLVHAAGAIAEMAPYDDLAHPHIEPSEQVPGADLVTITEMTETPLGTLRLRATYRDGTRVSVQMVADDDPGDADVVTSWRWGPHLRWRRRGLTAHEAVGEGGKILFTREVSIMVLALGLVQAASLVDHFEALPEVPAEIVAYGVAATRLGWAEVAADRLGALDGLFGEPTDGGSPPPQPQRGLAPMLATTGTGGEAEVDVPLVVTVDQLGAEELIGRVVESCRAGWLHTGAQVVVQLDGEVVLDFAAGSTTSGHPFTSSTVSSLYCSTKPVVATGVLALCGSGAFPVDSPVGDLVDDGLPEWIKALTVSQLLAHTSGLHQLHIVTHKLCPPERRWEVVCLMPQPEEFRPGFDSAYADIAAWLVLGRIIEVVSGSDLDSYLTASVLGSWGVGEDDVDVVLSPERLASLISEGQLSVNQDRRGPEPIFMLGEGTEEWACVADAATGTYGTATGIAGIYGGLLADRNGANRVLPKHLAREATSASRPVMHDAILGRPVAYGLGCLCPPLPLDGDWFGHAAEGGLSFGAASVSRSLVVAAVFNGMLDGGSGLELRDAGLVRQVTALLDS